MLKLDLNVLAKELKSVERDLAAQLTERENNNKAFLRQFRIAILKTGITSKQSDIRLVDGHWRDISDSPSTPTLLGRLKPFWDVINPTLLDDVIKVFGDEGVKKRMNGLVFQLDDLKSNAMLLDFQIACVKREMTCPKNFTSKLKIRVPRATSGLSFKETESYHDALVKSASFHLSALRFVPAEPTHARSTVLTWHIPSNAVDVVKEYIDEGDFHDGGLLLESITLDDIPIQEYKEYQVHLCTLLYIYPYFYNELYFYSSMELLLHRKD